MLSFSLLLLGLSLWLGLRCFALCHLVHHLAFSHFLSVHIYHFTLSAQYAALIFPFAMLAL